MKKNKYIYILFASALALGACSSDDAINGEQNKPVPQAGEVLAFNGTISDDMEILQEEDLDAENTPSKAKSRIAVNTDFQISKWFTNDKISVSDGTLNYTYSPDKETEGARSVFTTSGNSFTTDGTGEESIFYAFYPSEAVESWNGAEVQAMIWTEQLYSENMEQSGVLGPYIAAKTETTGGGANASFDFGHICSVIDVDLSSFDGGTVDAVAIYSNSKNSLAGRVKYNLDSKAITVANNDAAGYAAQQCISDLVTVSNVNAANPVVRFYVLPINQPTGITITVRTTDGKFYSKTSTAEVGKSAINTDYIASMSNQTGNVCLPYYKKYKFGTIASAKQNMWMAMIPDNLRLRQLTVPGAHNAATSNVGNADSKCQSETISGLLANGVRAFDLRPRYTRSLLESQSVIELDNLEIYHGIRATGVLFKDAVATLVNFVQTNPTEALFINMQKENTSGTQDESSTWRTSIRTCFQNNAAYLLSSIETYQNFGDARGKIVVISKNPYGNESVYSDVVYGGIVQDWGDNASVENAYLYKQGGGKVVDASVEDTYNPTNVSTKQGLVSAMLTKAEADKTTRWYFTWNNIAYKLLGDTPAGWAATMNPWLTNYINNTVSANRLGMVYADFIGSSSNGGVALLKAIINHNFKYVYLGRTRKVSSSGTPTGASIAGDEYADDTEVYVKTR